MKLDIRLRIALFLLLTLVLYGCSSTGGSGAGKAGLSESQEPETHLTLSTDYYSLDYPAGWQKVEQDGLVGLKTPKSGPDDAFLDNVVVNLAEAQPGLTLDGHVEGAVETLKSVVESFSLLEVGFTRLSGIDARKLVYAGSSGGVGLKFTQVIAINDGIMYVITYSAAENSYSEYLGELDDILASFTVTSKESQVSDAGSAEAEQASQGGAASASNAVSDYEKSFIGLWRIYSEAIFYDAGGNDWLDMPSTRKLELKADRTWNFGSSSGTWAVSAVTDENWERWAVADYGPEKKLTLYGWNDDMGDGPVEESSGNIDFFWVIYRTGPPTVKYPGQIQMKFGKTDLSQ